MNRFRVVFLLILTLFVYSTASAHSTVSPKETSTETFQTFSLSVPTERDVPTTKVSLTIPSGLTYVTPFVKPGWKIDVKKDADGAVTAIEWSGSSIPADFKDEFQFSAETPSSETTLVWKAYQTYQDGTLVSWDQAGGEDAATPYSETHVTSAEAAKASGDSSFANLTFGVAVLALLISMAALLFARRRALT